jgi:hypothetical protein
VLRRPAGVRSGRYGASFDHLVGAGNLSDLLDEQGSLTSRVDCLRRTLEAAPDYADAMFNLALLLQRNNKHAEAAEQWRRYLANDTQSEWAARARRYARGLTRSAADAAPETGCRAFSCRLSSPTCWGWGCGLAVMERRGGGLFPEASYVR